MSNKRLYRSSTNYMLASVCGAGTGIVAYIIAAIIIPK